MKDEQHPRKLIIQIPCYNEEFALPHTLRSLPAQVEGYDVVEVVVIDDGSSDATVEVARAHGVQHIISHGHNRGLAQAFMTGLETASRLGAHTVVNLDADNQYVASDIPKLTAPILRGEVKVVIGTRPIASIKRFSAVKKILQIVGTKVIQIISGTQIEDAASGFRAMHIDIARRLRIYSHYTYTVEMIIQLGYQYIPMQCVPIGVNEEDLRPSRLVRSNIDYLWRSLDTILRMFVLFRPRLFFTGIAGLLFCPAMFIALRYLYFMSQGQGLGHVQSLLLALVLTLTAVACMLIGFACDATKINRLLLEDIRYRLLLEPKN